MNLSFTGDGATPSSLELFEAQERALQPMRAAGNVGDQGDFGWSIPVDLPPALPSPEFGSRLGSTKLASTTVPESTFATLDHTPVDTPILRSGSVTAHEGDMLELVNATMGPVKIEDLK